MAIAAASIAAGGAVLGGVLGSSGAKKAAKKQYQAQMAALAEQQRQYNIALGLQQPFAVTGTGAENMLARLYGLPYQGYSAPNLSSAGTGSFKAKSIVKMLQQGMSIDDIVKLGSLAPGKTGKRVNYLLQHGLTPEQISQLQAGPQGAPGAQSPIVTPTGPDLSVFQNSPGYQFRRQEGQRDIGNSFAARGGAFSGNALKGITDFNQNLASEDYYNFVNQLNNLAGHGQTAVTNSGQFAQNYGNAAANALGNAGDARASGVANSANIWGNALGGIANIFGQYWANRGTPPIVPPPSDNGGMYGYGGSSRSG